MSDKEKGTVKFFNDKKGYGFITKEDGSDVFVHFSSIVSDNDFKTLKQDQAVEFEVESDDRGDKAVNVTAAQLVSNIISYFILALEKCLSSSMVEQWPLKPLVVGSSPSWGTKII